MTSDDVFLRAETLVSSKASAPPAAAADGMDRDPGDPRDVRNLLTDEQLARLRRGYSADAMSGAAKSALMGPYPPAKAFVEFILGHFYTASRWEPGRREQCIITYFASRSAGNAANLGIHIYWGLMEGLSPEMIADTILLAAAYSGVENYATSIGTMKHVLTVLRDLANDPDERAVDCVNVTQKLRG